MSSNSIVPSSLDRSNTTLKAAGIETALASGRGTSEDSNIPLDLSSFTTSKGGKNIDATKLFRTQMALAAIDTQNLPTPKPDKYATIQSLERSKKIEALKDPRLDPAKIQDPYDALAHVFHTWTQVVKRMNTVNTDPKSINNKLDSDKIASNFYDGMIAPAYANAKLAPMEKSLWMKQAFSDAAEYKIEDAYESNFTHDLRNGWNTGLAATARGFGRITDMVGNTLASAVEEFKKGQGATNQSWYNRLGKAPMAVASVPKEDNVIVKGAKYQDAEHQFWADALPTRSGFWNKVTSTVAEGVANAPVFAAMDLVPAAGAETLTARLSMSTIGKKVAGLLTAGSEGLAYGAAVHKQNDPGEAWRDAIGFAVFHGAFDVLGLGLKKLVDIAPDAWKPKLDKYTQHLDNAQKGLTEDNALQLYDRHKTEVANNIAAVGVSGQHAIFVDALHHVDDMQHFKGMIPEDIKEWEQHNLEKDPAHWAPVLSAAKFIRDWLGNRRIADLKPEEETELGTKIAQLIYDSSAEISSRVQDAQEQSEQKAAVDLKQPSAKHTLQYYSNLAQQALTEAPGASSLVSPEQIQKYAEKLYAEDLQKATAKAQKELATDKVADANSAARAIKKRPGYTIRSERTTNKYGEPAVRYSAVPDYKVRLREHVRAAKQQDKSLGDYFRDLDDKDFVDDMNQYFYPKSLKDAGVFFEHQNTREGMQNPNFLAFMYNYLDQMPKEFGQELEQRLVDTMKVQQFMKGRRPIEPQLTYYAKAMYNHVDNFLGSGRWPKESNLFRSSNADMWKSTQWQRELLIEKTIQEQKNIKSAFRGKARDLALASHSALAKARMQEFDNANMKDQSQDKIRDLDNQISNVITKTGKFDRWEF